MSNSDLELASGLISEYNEACKKDSLYTLYSLHSAYHLRRTKPCINLS